MNHTTWHNYNSRYCKLMLGYRTDCYENCDYCCFEPEASLTTPKPKITITHVPNMVRERVCQKGLVMDDTYVRCENCKFNPKNCESFEEVKKKNA